MVGNLKNIDIDENRVIVVQILSSFNGKITVFAKINMHDYLHGNNMKNPNRENKELGYTYTLV